jgi:hypothetical protein
VPTLNADPTPRALLCDEVLRVAREDAQTAYRDLSGYRITLFQDSEGWHVHYDLPKPLMAGGGPRYLIDPKTGEILSKKYYQ